jgi:predicted ATP-grasp superfamily ATP-dependent carboligase
MSVEDFNVIDLIEENAKLKLDVAELERRIEDLEEQVKTLLEIIECEIDENIS